ncbi:MAG: hypothetical protein U0237_03255 [Thermoleophilia bacterium]
MSADGSTVLASDFSGNVIAWRAGGEVRLVGHTGTVGALDLTADGGLAVTGSADRTVRVWDTRTGRELAVLRGHEGPIETSVRFSGDGRIVASAASDGVRLWDWRAGTELVALPAERPAHVALTADGGWVAAMATRPGGYRLLRWRCDVCGGVAAVEDLARERVTRDLSDGERAQFGIN